MSKSRMRASLSSVYNQVRLTTPLKMHRFSSVSQRPNTTIERIGTDNPSASQKKTLGVQPAPKLLRFISLVSMVVKPATATTT